MRQLALTFLALLLTTSATANARTSIEAHTLAGAEAQLSQGRWQEASTAAAALHSAEGYALASTAVFLGAGLSPNEQKKAMFQQAQAYVTKALAADPANARAHFQLAAAKGRLAQFLGILQSASLASDAKRHLDKTIALDSKMANAYVALGLWHANLVNKLGVLAGLKGASRNEVASNFKKAILGLT